MEFESFPYFVHVLLVPIRDFIALDDPEKRNQTNGKQCT